MSDPVLTLRKFATSEDADDQEALKDFQRADQYAVDIVVGGVLSTCFDLSQRLNHGMRNVM